MNATPWSEVQLLNFHALSVLRSALAHDPLRACAMFGIRRAEAERLEQMLSADRILAAVVSVGNDSLIAPLRSDLLPLLASPTPLLGALAVVRRQGAGA